MAATRRAAPPTGSLARCAREGEARPSPVGDVTVGQVLQRAWALTGSQTRAGTLMQLEGARTVDRTEVGTRVGLYLIRSTGQNFPGMMRTEAPKGLGGWDAGVAI